MFVLGCRTYDRASQLTLYFLYFKLYSLKLQKYFRQSSPIDYNNVANYHKIDNDKVVFF